MDESTRNQLIEKLTKLSERKCWCDDEDFCVFDYSGSNVDDAYHGGRDDGEALLAGEILKVLVDDKLQRG